MTLALGIALLLIVLQVPMKWASFLLIGPTEDVAPLAATYFYIVVWGAPAVLGLYSLSGWFIGMQNTRFPMVIAIGQNVVNILASLTLVYVFGMKIEGVALGTVIAQYAGFIVALGLLGRYYGRLFRGGRREECGGRYVMRKNQHHEYPPSTLLLLTPRNNSSTSSESTATSSSARSVWWPSTSSSLQQEPVRGRSSSPSTR